jgi:hypothetical protein
MLHLVRRGAPVGGEPCGQLAVTEGPALLEEAEQALQGAAAAQEEQPVLDGVEGDGGVVVARGHPAPHIAHPVVVAPPAGGQRHR